VEKIRKILQSQTIKDTLISFVGLGFTAIIGFIYTVVLARTLGPEYFGVFSAITSLVAIIYSLGDLGISSAIINFIPKISDKRQGLISTGFWFEFVISIIILVIFSILSIFHKTIIPGSIPEQLLLAGVVAINYLFINYAQAVFTAERKFVTYSLSQIVDAGIKITIVFVLLSTSKLSISTAILANIVSTIIAIIYSYSRDLIKIKLNFDTHIFSKMFQFAKWIAVSKIFAVFTTRIDIILLNLMLGSFHAGIFSAASRITLFFSLLISSLGSVVNPRFSGFDTNIKVKAYMKKLSWLIGTISIFMVLSALLAQPIVNVVFGDKYLSSIPVFQALTLAMIPFMFTLITTPALTYTFSNPSFIAKLTAVQVMIMIAIDLIFIPSLGAFAPALALAVGNIVALIASIIKLKLLFKSHA
jgi:O-antigen/teichoic acid export membrane protein